MAPDLAGRSHHAPPSHGGGGGGCRGARVVAGRGSRRSLRGEHASMPEPRRAGADGGGDHRFQQQPAERLVLLLGTMCVVAIHVSTRRHRHSPSTFSRVCGGRRGRLRCVHCGRRARPTRRCPAPLRTRCAPSLSVLRTMPGQPWHPRTCSLSGGRPLPSALPRAAASKRLQA